ncbi:hypothetical protein PybrP1_013045 [[Pythium] brassicae (nom. inval.)]|nr:hypothetical protein PybrP1_013045 [[Pythium] brassicae (nom. inval.)]
MSDRARRSDFAAAPTDSGDDSRPLHPLVQWDLEIVTWLARKKEDLPWLRAAVHATTSRRRTQDLSLLLWFVFLLALSELGLSYMWICIGNLLGTDPDTNGFPCVDTHMSVVVLLPVVLHTPSYLVQLLLVLGYCSATTDTQFAAAIVALVVFLMIVLGSWIENNESRLLGVPKQDYLDVLGNILNSEPPVRVHRQR